MTSSPFPPILVDDTSPNITYTGNWTFGVNVEADYNLYNNTDSYSAEQGAAATLHFYGTAVEYWGNYYNTHGPCNITLDGDIVDSINAYADTQENPGELYHASGLELGDHTLTVTVATNTAPNKCEIDKFVVNVTPSNSSGVSNSTSSPLPSGTNIPTPISKSKSSSAGAIAGGVVGGIAFLCLLFFAFWWYRRSNRTQIPGPSAFEQNTTDKPTPAASGKAAYMGTPTTPGDIASTSSRPMTSHTGFTPSSEVESTLNFQTPFQVPVFQAPPPYAEH